MRVDPSFEAFVGEHSHRLLRTAFLLTGDRGHAEDLLQSALLRTLRHWSQAQAAPLGYTRQILVNLARDRIRWLRRRPPETVLPDDSDALRVAVDAGTERVHERHRVADALARLPIRQRQVVVLRFFEDLSVPQTAAVLGCSEGTVKSYTSRAVARLRELLTDELEVSHGH